MSGKLCEVEIAQTQGRRWHLWLLNPSGNRASVEPFEQFQDADVLAEFVAKYAGREAESAPSPKSVDGGVELESSPKKNDKTKE
ncbi:hypothetical protein LCGC14_2299650 [marine sediment metagenome]|uniref:Uncharacterized protein n=1 Tax=marine sediment metagenome TaxID=412755 RepID=A0A0F9CNS5_9ZZZZ